jgi:hypothetical protein
MSRMTSSPNDAVSPVPGRVAAGLLLALVSFGWIVPALVGWYFSATAAHQIAAGTRGQNSFPYEGAAADCVAVAWWWGLVAAVAWALAGAGYLRLRVTQARR